MDPPGQDEMTMCLAWMVDQYGALPVCPDNWMDYDRYLKMLTNLDKTSSPGYPYMQQATTIGKWLKDDGLGNFDPVRVQMLWSDVQLVLAGEYDHLFRVFIKDEPHKIKKVREGRWRLIIASSLPVQMVWRLAFSHQNDWLNAHPYQIPSAHGLIFPHGGWMRFRAHLETKGLKWSRDISAWDINMPGWVVDVVRRFRLAQGGPDDWIRVVNQLYADAFQRAKLLFSDGTMLQQDYTGFMKSGLFNTISDNSLGMIPMHIIASRRSGLPVGSVWATGDDVLQTHMSDSYVEKLEALGCVVKEVEEAKVFMGTSFETKPTPMYFSKHVVNFCSSREYLGDILDSYMRLYCHTPDFYLWFRVAENMGYKTKPRFYYQFWYDSPLSKLIM